MLFVNRCTACEKSQLIFPSLVKGVRETEKGLELVYTCWCGSEQSYLEVPAEELRKAA